MASRDFLQMMLQCSSRNHYTHPEDSSLIDYWLPKIFYLMVFSSCWGFLSPPTEQEGSVRVLNAPRDPSQQVKGRNLWINTLTPSFLNGEISRHVQQSLKRLEGIWAQVIHSSYMHLSALSFCLLQIGLPSKLTVRMKSAFREFTRKCS